MHDVDRRDWVANNNACTSLFLFSREIPSRDFNRGTVQSASIDKPGTSHPLTSAARKGVSFLSRFISTKKKNPLDASSDNGSTASLDPRPEGMDATLFSHAVDNMGFSPKHPPPPSYIKMRSKHKKEKEFEAVFLAQELRCKKEKKRHSVGPEEGKQPSGAAGVQNPVWALEFSKDGSRNENLCIFKHNDFVPSIQFHPRDDRFFLAGSLDTKLRLWSIPDKSVAYTVSVPDMITSVAFTPDGKTCIAGTLGGLCLFYDTEGLKWQSQIHVKSTRGQNAKGSKITGIQAVHWPPGASTGDVKLLVTSNDSRIRVYGFRDKNLEMKFRGHENNCSQIRASFAQDTPHIICGSEDRKAYIWSTASVDGEKRNHRPVEMFEAHSSITTCATIAPLATRLLLSASEDPIFDLCNPPPVTLVSRSDSATASHGSVDPADSSLRKVAESPAYLARSAHPDGHVIVTADYTGAIKVYRQDCAHQKRVRAENWDAYRFGADDALAEGQHEYAGGEREGGVVADESLA
ncbi:hypothetical protein GRF29_28g158682 [Pseudopithomyces chartarum]|uniref:WD40 repeat-like protein n=1 Tax=Pseudopithomyces chartarum TaxID=1892770 RepID=A0AAN6M0I8_9PLEO|nr:hypothetical protein GRF29_28g158682 [Pseudopithomyces chartarum]